MSIDSTMRVLLEEAASVERTTKVIGLARELAIALDERTPAGLTVGRQLAALQIVIGLLLCKDTTDADAQKHAVDIAEAMPWPNIRALRELLESGGA